MESTENLLKAWTFWVSEGVECAAGILIALAALQAFLKSILDFIKRRAIESPPDSIRLTLGRWLALALEFELAADILRTAVAPTWNEIGQLAAIIVLRTALNYFLQREIELSMQKAP